MVFILFYGTHKASLQTHTTVVWAGKGRWNKYMDHVELMNAENKNVIMLKLYVWSLPEPYEVHLNVIYMSFIWLTGYKWLYWVYIKVGLTVYI